MAFGISYYQCSEQLITEIEQLIHNWQSENNEFESVTSGSTGQPKRIIHTRNQLIASAKRTNTHFNLSNESKVLLCLSPKTIGGKMVLIRALVGDYSVSCVAPQKNPFTTIPNTERFDFVSLVPYQLEAILTEKPASLSTVKCILIGGATLSQKLEKECAQLHAQCFIGFGMTETISHIALRKFAQPYYTLLPGVSLTSNINETIINDSHLSINNLLTTDIVHQINEQQFEWLGRADFVINSGGIKIHPEQLEQIISPLLAIDFLITGIPDESLGERCVLVTVTAISNENWTKIKQACANTLGKFVVPKGIIQSRLYYLPSGKIDRLTTKKMISNHND